MYCMHCSMSKGTYQAEAVSSNDKINSVTLDDIELCLTEGNSKLFSKKIPLNN